LVSFYSHSRKAILVVRGLYQFFIPKFQLEALLNLKKKMTVRDIKTFLPFSINLDPYIKKVIKDEYQIHEEVVNNIGRAPPLTQRQAAGLNRKLSAETSKSGSMPGLPQAPVPPSFHNFGLHMSPWQSFHQPQPGFNFDSRGVTPPDHAEIDLDPELTLKPLSRKSVDEVCQVNTYTLLGGILIVPTLIFTSHSRHTFRDNICHKCNSHDLKTGYHS
jgi:hypothetical protein